MKLISMFGLATFLLGTEAKCKDMHHHVRVVLQPWNEDDCAHKAYRDGHKMKHDHCETFDAARSMNLQYQGKHHDQISDLSNCNIVVFDEARCHGSKMTIPLAQAFSTCTNFNFTDAAGGGAPRHAGRSAKWHCAAAAKVGKGNNSTETVTVHDSTPVVVVPTAPASIVTVTPSVPVVIVTETRKPKKAPASTSTVVVAPEPTTMTLTETSSAGSTSKTFTFTLVTTATASWETRVV